MNMSKKILIANWKSHKTASEAQDWLTTFAKKHQTFIEEMDHCQVIIAPSFLYLEAVIKVCDNLSGVSVAAQDVSHFPLGSYTGAVAARQLASLGVSHALVGHSERRKYFGETHSLVAQKIEQLIEAKITPIVCVDEQEIQQQAELITKQQASNCIIAYEPASAIGSGMGQDLPQVHKAIDIAKKAFGDVPVLYGGSVDERNIHEYLLVADGALVGGSSLDVELFIQLISATNSKP